MVQVSVGRSIAQAYGFLFRRILTVIGLSWVAATFFIVLRKALLGLGPVPHDIIAHWPVALEHLGGVIAALLLLCAIAVPLTRAALGDAMEWSLAHFVIGARELRLFAALVRLYLIVIAVVVLCALGMAGIGMGAKMALAQWPALAGTGLPVKEIAVGIGALIAVLVTIYVSVRLSFLLYAIAAAEPHASLKRSWDLAKGNVLRMFLIVLAIVLPICALLVAADYALMGQPLIDTLRAAFAARPPNQAPVYTLLASHGWGVAVFASVIFVVSTVLQGAASASAYRGLLGLDAAETPAVVEEVVLLEEVHEAPAEHHAEPVEHHDDHGHDDSGHDAHGHDDHGHDDHGHADHGHDAHGHDDHGHGAAGHGEGAHHDAPAEKAHGEEAHAADHAEHDAHGHGAGGDETHAPDGPHGHDGHGEEAHGGHGAAEHHEVHAAEAHVEDAHAEEAHGEDAHAVEVHGDAPHAEEPHREVEHA